MFRHTLAVLWCAFLVLMVVLIGLDFYQKTCRKEGGASVEKIFVKDGCSAYRFYEAGHPRYFVKCEDAAAMTTWDRPETSVRGLSSNEPESISTSNISRD